MYERFKRKIQPLINIYHLIKAIIANIIFGFPSRKIKVIGVTGTDGKTTTTHLIHHILESAGQKAAIISSISAPGLHTTTPDAWELQKLIKDIVKSKKDYLVLETTSHSLDQNRVWGIRYEVGVITNITLEHLDYHKTYDNYLKTKAKLLLNSKASVINADDESFEKLREILKAHNKKYYSYGLKDKADFTKDFRRVLKNITSYNNYNYLAAYSAAQLLRIVEDATLRAIKSFKLPEGRFEVVYDKDFMVVIDFAHTSNALEKVLAAVKYQFLKKDGRVIHVFGAAGLRDAQKRQAMGEASAKYADITILTEEDYRTEDPKKICEEIAEGMKKLDKKPHAVIVDREKAIRTAIGLAKSGDVVITTGKSHERSLCRGKIEYPWDEKKVILTALL